MEFCEGFCVEFCVEFCGEFCGEFCEGFCVEFYVEFCDGYTSMKPVHVRKDKAADAISAIFGTWFDGVKKQVAHGLWHIPHQRSNNKCS